VSVVGGHVGRRQTNRGSPSLVHDGAAQAFYTPSGEVALSRARVDLQRLMDKEREKAWASEGA
jgi:hypothetical protein